MLKETSEPSTTKIIFKNEARKQLFEGLELAAEAVSCTLGPRGKTVLIQSGDQAPIVTKDGVTVSKSIKLKSPIRRMGAQLVKQAASQTNEVAGDGTTTSTVLTYSMVKEGLKLLEGGYSSRALCSGLEKARTWLDESLKTSAKVLTTQAEIAQVGTISANGDSQIGDLIAKAMSKVGRDGIITVEEAKGMSTSLEVVEGMQLDRGYLSPYFVTNPEKMNAVYSEARVLVTDKKLSLVKELLPILERSVRTNKPLFIVADDIEGEALQALVLNKLKANLQVVAIKAPGYGKHRDELLEDMCVLTGSKLVSAKTGLKLEEVQDSDLGTLKKVVVDAKTSTLVGSGATAPAVSEHAANLKTQLEDVTLTSEEIIKLRTRIAKLSSGVAVIKVGGATEVEMVERKYRIEDALNATKAAAEEGIVPGGGMALLSVVDSLRSKIQGSDMTDEEKAGASIVLKSCYAPLRRIVENAGLTADVVINELARNPGKGYNAATAEYVDMLEVGVIDPVKVSRTALKSAASVAVTFLSLDAVVVEESQDG